MPRPARHPYVYKGPSHADVEWWAVQDEVQRFNRLLALVRRSPDLSKFLATPAGESLVEGLSAGDGIPTERESATGRWLRRNWPFRVHRRELLNAETGVIAAAQRVMKAYRRPEMFPELVPVLTSGELEDALNDYTKALTVFLDQAGPRSFSYGGLKVFNPDRMPDKVVQGLLGGLDYVKALFRRRGVEPVLDEALDQVVVRHQAKGETAHGWYLPSKGEIHLLSPAGQKKGGRLLRKWVNEVFLHEVGHHVHMTLMHPRAREEWDAAWTPVIEAEKAVEKRMEEIRSVSAQERARFWDLLTKAEGNLRRIKLRGIDRMKFHAWLREPLMGEALVTPKQLRWTAYGKRRIGDLFADPVAYFEDRDILGAGGTREERVQKMYDRAVGKLRDLLGVADGDYAHPVLTDKEVEQYRSEDTSVDAALDALEMPSGYARTDEREDFAESFVAFLANPEALSDQARFRMQRALSLSNLYGKPIMRLAADPARVAARWINASVLTLPYLKKLIDTVVSDPTGWGEHGPAATMLRRLIRSIELGNEEPFPVAELWEYLESRDVGADEIEVLKTVRPPRAPRKRKGPSFYDAWRAFERETGKSTVLVNIDLDGASDHLAPAMMAVTQAVARLPRRAAKLWDSQVKKVRLRSGSRGTEDASWDSGGVMTLVLGKNVSVPGWRHYIVHELGHALEEKLGLTVTPWDETPYGQPPYVSGYAEMNATEDFAETFRALEMEPGRLKRLAPEKYGDMRGRT